jgi:hypothetical protein
VCEEPLVELVAHRKVSNVHVTVAPLRVIPPRRAQVAPHTVQPPQYNDKGSETPLAGPYWVQKIVKKLIPAWKDGLRPMQEDLVSVISDGENIKLVERYNEMANHDHNLVSDCSDLLVQIRNEIRHRRPAAHMCYLSSTSSRCIPKNEV